MVARLMGNRLSNGDALLNTITNYDRSQQNIPIYAWKLVYCGLYYIDGSNATLDDIYQERLREEELQTPAARAREIIRHDVMKVSRRNAKWMLSGLEKLSDAERAQQGPAFRQTLIKVWKQESHPPPSWIQNIIDVRKQWGFVYYMSTEVDQKYGYDWETIWERIQESSNRPTLQRLATEDWPTFHANSTFTEDNDFRKHFSEYMEEKDDPLPAGISLKTFIVIPIELIPTLCEDDDSDESEDDEPAPYWVWAYDADWDTSSEEVINGEKYQERVKVAIYSLKSWFYAACWEGISLRDIWLKAQQHPERLWVCRTKHMEEWDHEAYV
ncbi:hypothetical protein FOVG_16994 [Fusarium oxysporum f. sp. pisi HDV247]|uniref:Uncharacterized protein n=1 Tax=Fusarium oxysporum f. sp. pisi HDV247 TaxID=1080344 RepID=W9NP46_FUSOX|nr:hypothetical protein FOVG_16994 [Fusarium oxysporum f. sp. pisi HDV247]